MGSGVSHPQHLGATGLGLREQIPGTLLMPARAGDTSCFWEHSHGHVERFSAVIRGLGGCFH